MSTFPLILPMLHVKSVILLMEIIRYYKKGSNFNRVYICTTNISFYLLLKFSVHLLRCLSRKTTKRAVVRPFHHNFLCLQNATTLTTLIKMHLIHFTSPLHMNFLSPNLPQFYIWDAPIQSENSSNQCRFTTNVQIKNAC